MHLKGLFQKLVLDHLMHNCSKTIYITWNTYLLLIVWLVRTSSTLLDIVFMSSPIKSYMEHTLLLLFQWSDVTRWFCDVIWWFYCVILWYDLMILWCNSMILQYNLIILQCNLMIMPYNSMILRCNSMSLRCSLSLFFWYIQIMHSLNVTVSQLDV